MPVIQSRTREDIRLAVGHNIGAVWEGTTASAGATGGTTVADSDLWGADDEHNGKWILITSAGADGQLRYVSDYDSTSVQVLTVNPAFTVQIASGVTYELWHRWAHPNRIHNLINQAIDYSTGRFWVPDNDISLHSYTNGYRYPIPTAVRAISKVQYRYAVASKSLHSCDSVWDELVQTGLAAVADDEDLREGSASLRVTVTAADAAANARITDNITSADISGYDYLECWIKCSVALAAADYHILLDNTAQSASPLETLEVPALTANRWTYIRIALANPRLNTAIISVALRQTTDLASDHAIWLDDVKVVKDLTQVWRDVPNDLWHIDRESQELMLYTGGLAQVGYSLLRLVGYDMPVQLTADSSTVEISPEFIIAKATALAFMSDMGGSQTDPDDKRNSAQMWMAQSERLYQNAPIMQNFRLVR